MTDIAFLPSAAANKPNHVHKPGQVEASEQDEEQEEEEAEEAALAAAAAMPAQLAVATSGSAIWLLDGGTLRCRATLQGHADAVLAMAVGNASASGALPL